MHCIVSGRIKFDENVSYEKDFVYLGQQFSHQPIPFPRLLVFEPVVTVLNPFECVVEF